jgi:hypothetical protein
MTQKDLKLFQHIVGMSEKTLLNVLDATLRKYYDKVITTEHYIIAEGDIPVGLVAHLDTVYKYPARNIYHDPIKKVIWSPEGLGADDRAGVLGILHLITDKNNYRPWIFFTTQEESGGLGASIMAEELETIPNIKFLIELDRCGEDDCVFYECNNTKFHEYIESFGFKKRRGSFSDISFIMGEWGICGVNLSIGYENEHSYSETFHYENWEKTIEKVKNILSQESYPDFEYIEDNYMISRCVCCKKQFYSCEVIPVKGQNYCIDCAVKLIDWCKDCGQPYLIEEKCHCKEVIN